MNLKYIQPLHIHIGNWICKEQWVLFLVTNFEIFMRVCTTYPSEAAHLDLAP